MKNHFRTLMILLVPLLMTACYWTDLAPAHVDETVEPAGFSPADAEAGIQAAFEGDRATAALYICEDELEGVSDESFMPEDVEIEVSCHRNGDQMECDVAFSNLPDDMGEELIFSVTADIEDEKLCNFETDTSE